MLYYSFDVEATFERFNSQSQKILVIDIKDLLYSHEQNTSFKILYMKLSKFIF